MILTNLRKQEDSWTKTKPQRVVPVAGALLCEAWGWDLGQCPKPSTGSCEGTAERTELLQGHFR